MEEDPQESLTLVVDEAQREMTLIKHLASCNTTTRNKSLKQLLTWLSSQSQVSEEHMKKLWKGLFYCLWHADKSQAQSDLINRLSSLVLRLDLPLSLHYVSTFFLTMRREWPGIDHLRVDKFYLLIRCFVCTLFRLLRNNKWDSELLRTLMGVLEEKVFLADDKFIGNGVSYHVVSVFLDELKPFLPVQLETLDVMFKPFLDILCKCKDKVLVSKVKSCVFDMLLTRGRDFFERKRLGSDGVEDELMLFGTIALTAGFSGKFFALGSSADCHQGNRKVLFDLHKAFLRLDKELESSQIAISLPEVNFAEAEDEDEDEVPKLIPIVASGEIESNGQNDAVTFDETVVANLRMQFEKVAAESGKDAMFSCDSIVDSVKCTKKRKRGKNAKGRDKGDQGDLSGNFEDAAKSSAKKVRFAMKNNLIWKPHSPLPPQDLRLPPSLTPRGSALKKGIPPGPVKEISPTMKKVKQKKKKKGRKAVKAISPAIKRLRKLQAITI